MKTFASFCLLFLLFANSFTFVNAQPYNGQFDVAFEIAGTDNTVQPYTIDVDILVRASQMSNTFHMGSANYRFQFNTNAINNPRKDSSLGFEGFYQSAGGVNIYTPFHNITGSIFNVISYNTFYSFGPGILVDTTWAPVGRMRFDVVDVNKAMELKFLFANQGAGQGTVMSEIGELNQQGGNYNLYPVTPGQGDYFNGDLVIYFGDHDNDEIADWLDEDADNDGIPNWEETCGPGSSQASCFSLNPFLDSDDDGYVNYRDVDYCQLGLNQAGVCMELDRDIDGKPDMIDLDSDGDGITDIQEIFRGEAYLDADNDGQVDCTVGGMFYDTDGDGWCDTYDNTGGVSGTPLSFFDTDQDGYYDFQDIDSDNDGITDNIEWQPSWTFALPSGFDNDGDGIDEAYDKDSVGVSGTSGVRMAYTDLDRRPDYRDTDSDNDSKADYVEGWDLTGNGLSGNEPNPGNFPIGSYPQGTDTDEDGLIDIYDTVVLDTNTVYGDNATNGFRVVTNMPYNSFFPSSPVNGGPDLDWRRKGKGKPITIVQTLKATKLDGQVKGATTDPTTKVSPAPASLSLYPNPAKDLVKLAYVLPTDEALQLHIYNAEGRLVQNKNLPVSAGSHEISIEIRNLSSGIYLVQFRNSYLQQSIKLWVE